jgi:hypothetical protein
MVRLPNQRSTDSLPTFSFHCPLAIILASISSTRHRSSLRHTYLLGAQFLVSPSNGLEGYKKPSAGSTEPVRAPDPLDPMTLPETETARAGLRTVHAMLNTPALLAVLSFLLTTLSDSIFGDVRVQDARSRRRVLCTARE